MQHTDLTTIPFFDDYDASKNYHRVLFKPGRSIQVRELQQIQDYCIDQHDRIGRHLFQEGSVVIPGGINSIYPQDTVTVTFLGGNTIDQLTTAFNTNDVS